MSLSIAEWYSLPRNHSATTLHEPNCSILEVSGLSQQTQTDIHLIKSIIDQVLLQVGNNYVLLMT